MSTYQLTIDGSAAEAGAERIEKSFDRIKAAATRMEGGVLASANKMVAAFKTLSGVRGISREAIDSLNSLGNTLAKYRGPTKTSTENTGNFLAMLRANAGVRAPSVAGLDRFLGALNKYAGPTPTAGKNTGALLSALSGFNGISGTGSRVTAFLAALSGFRGPHANAGKNVQALLSALQSFNGVPRGLSNSTRDFIAFAAALDKATASFRELRSASSARIPSPPAVPTARGGGDGGGGSAARANSALRDQSSLVRTLAGDHNFLQTALLRTQTALNALGGVLAARSIVEASNAVLKIDAQLRAATGSIQQGRVQFQYLTETTQRLGLDLVSTSRAYGLFLGSIKGTNVTIGNAQQIFEGFATAGRALQLSTSDMDGVFRALGQIISKGKLQAEELRGQLGDRLPGAFVRMAAALNLLPSELDDAMKKGEISGKRLDDALLAMAASLKTEFADAAKQASLTVEAAFNRTRNAFTLAAAGLGQSGLNEGLINIADSLTKFINSEGLAQTLRIIGEGFKLLGDNINLVATLAGGYAFAMVYKYITGLVATQVEAVKTGSAFAGLTRLQDVYTAASQRSTAAAVEQALAQRGLSTSLLQTGTATTGAATNVGRYGLTVTQAAAATQQATTSVAGAVQNIVVGGNTAAKGMQTVNVAAADVSRGLAATTKSFTGFAAGAANLGSASAAVSGSVGAVTNAVTGQGAALAAGAGRFAAFSGAVSGLAGTAAGAGAAVGTVTSSLGGVGAATATAAKGVGAFGTALTGQAAATGVASGAVGTFGAVTTATSRATTVSIGPTAAATAGIVAQGVATTATTVATGFLAGSLAVLRAALMSLPLIALVAGFAALISYLSSLKSKGEEAADAMRKLGSANADATNFAEAYAHKLATTTGAMDENTRAIRDNITATLAKQALDYKNADVGFTVRRVKKGEVLNQDKGAGLSLGSFGVANTTQFQTATRDGTMVTGPDGKPISRAEGAAYSRVYQVQGGRFKPKDVNTNADLAQVFAAVGELTALQEAKSLSANGQKTLDVLKGRLQTAKTAQDTKQRGALDYTGVAASFNLPNYNNLPPSANLPEGQSKADQDAAKKAAAEAKKAARAAAAAGRQDEADLRRAMEGVRDMRREVVGAYDAIEALSTSGEAGVAQAARAMATARLDNIEDSYASVERAQAGIQKFAGMLQAQAKGTVDALSAAQALIAKADAGEVVDQDKLAAAKRLIVTTTQQEVDSAKAMAAANVSGYAAARAAATNYLGSQEAVVAARKKEQQLAASIREANDDTTRRSGGAGDVKGVDLVGATIRGGKELREATFRAEALKEVSGTTKENQEGYVQALIDSKRRADDLNQSLEVARQLNADMLEARNAADTLPLFNMGLKPEDLQFYETLIRYRNELINQGKTADQVDFMVGQRRGMLELSAATDRVRKNYEQLQQVSQDYADAIVDGFRRGAEEGQSFGRTIKDIFRDLKATLLNFVLYNPLKNFLTETITGRSGGGVGGVSAAQGLASNMGSASDLIASFAGSSDYFGGGTGKGSAAGSFLVQNSGGIDLGSLLGPTSSATSAFAKNAPQFGVDLSNSAAQIREAADITVTGQRAERKAADVALTRAANAPSQFEGLKKIFDYKANGQQLSKGFAQVGAAFKGTDKLATKLSTFGKGLGQVAGAAGTAFAAYSVGKSVAASIGIKGAAGEAIGGAAAGFSVGGPVGAAIGGAIGLAKGLLFPKKTPQANAKIVVTAEGGRGELGGTSADNKTNKGLLDAAKASATAGGRMFAQYANTLDSYLKAGNYGSFGEAQIKNSPNKFYSVTGNVDRKGRPTGVRGVDYIASDSEDELQAFALRSQIKAGKFAGLNDIYKTIATNSTAKTTDDLSSDLNVGKQFLDFFDSAKLMSPLQKEADELKKSFDNLKRSSALLGLETSKLDAAYAKLRRTQKESFDFDIKQGILEIQDPIMAAYNALVKEYETTVGNAQAVGGDLAEVERLYGLKRTELLKQYAQNGVDAVKNAAKDMLTALTASTQSPLNAYTAAENARGEFRTLAGQIKAGDYTNIDNVQKVAQNYLDTNRATSRSSADYFDVFNEVTSFLQMLAEKGLGGSANGGTSTADIPQLPAISAVVDKLAKQNDDLLSTNKGIGAAIVEGNDSTEQLLSSINENIKALAASGGYYAGGNSLLSEGALAGYARTTSGVS